MERLTPMRAIRARCIDCSGDNKSEVKHCPVTDCPLYPYRMGRNPARAGKGGNLKALEAARRAKTVT